RQVMLSQHLVLISMLLVWFLARHTDDTYIKAALIFIPHSVTYFYLLFRSTPARSLINFKLIAVMLTVIFGSFHFYIMTMAPEQVNAPLDGLGMLIAFTLAMS